MNLNDELLSRFSKIIPFPPPTELEKMQLIKHNLEDIYGTNAYKFDEIKALAKRARNMSHR